MIKEVTKKEFKVKGCQIDSNGHIYDQDGAEINIIDILKKLYKNSYFDFAFSMTSSVEIDVADI